ncbi:hypothetical protein ASD24_24500 [Paenibacillus sp. Root52]|uniref:hypothetical protein n=1 Tax=Paenibacillus sp. Root52 TaxID=1736552 RepID=UPI0006FA729F|nr:hypothetical protein [Paenibacillus sp. Root52]KQY90960.1 hypothetical protein ASD24_24500 [Paenibacillus sp. Root52]
MKKKSVMKLLERAGLWETRSLQAAARGDFDRSGRLRTKALQLARDAERAEQYNRRQVKVSP